MGKHDVQRAYDAHEQARNAAINARLDGKSAAEIRKLEAKTAQTARSLNKAR